MLSYVRTAVGSATTYFRPNAGESSLALRTCVPISSSTPSGPTFVLDPQASFEDPPNSGDKHAIIQEILALEDLYQVLDISPELAHDPAALRRAYLLRSRFTHPDKYPDCPSATLAFQKLSNAYEILKNPSLRRRYDTNRSTASFEGLNRPAEETLNGVLYAVFSEFMDGDFEVVRTFLKAVNDVNPSFRFGDDNIELLVGSFRRLREIMLSGRTYLRVIRVEIIHISEISHSLRQLAFWDVTTRIRLSIQLVRVLLSVPVSIDKALEEEAEKEERRRGRDTNGQVRRPERRGLLNPKLKAVIGVVLFVLERSESVF